LHQTNKANAKKTDALISFRCIQATPARMPWVGNRPEQRG
jgi:hypothetical protein